MKLKQVTMSFAMLMIAVATGLASARPPTTIQGGKFMGLSYEFVLGDVGLAGLEVACVDAFNKKTRVCTSEEIIKAAPLKEPVPYDGAWVYPATVDATPDLVNGGFEMMDFSLTESTNLTNFSCRRWTITDATGLITYGFKTFRLDRCDVPRPVACCKAE